MIKTIFTTCLLTFSCSSGALKINEPKHLYNTPSLYGAYVLRDDNEEYIRNFIENHERGTYQIIIDNENYNETLMSCLVPNSTNNLLIGNLNHIKIQINVGFNYQNTTIDYFDFEGTDQSILYSRIVLDDLYVGDLNTLSEFYTYASNTNDVNYHTLYFNDFLYLTKNEYDLFNCFYTQQGNQYNTYYNGYYTVLSSPTYSGQVNWQISNIVNNNLFTAFTVYNKNLEAYLQSDTSLRVKSVDDGTIVNQRIYFNGIIPNMAYTVLNNNGVFAFVQDTAPTTWYEMILSVMDAPLYYLTSLFNFELFGMSVFIAFSSLMTLLIIVQIIKKVV